MLRLPVDVPLVQSSISKFREHYFSKPARLPLDVVIVVADVAEACGLAKLRQLSPPEMLFALLEAIALAIKTDDDELLANWRNIMLACPARFTRITCADKIHRPQLGARRGVEGFVSKPCYVEVLCSTTYVRYPRDRSAKDSQHWHTNCRCDLRVLPGDQASRDI